MLNHFLESAADLWKMDEFRIHKDRYLPIAPLFTLSALVFILVQYPNFISSKNRIGQHDLFKIELNLGYSSTLKNSLLYPKFLFLS